MDVYLTLSLNHGPGEATEVQTSTNQVFANLLSPGSLGVHRLDQHHWLVFWAKLEVGLKPSKKTVWLNSYFSIL